MPDEASANKPGSRARLYMLFIALLSDVTYLRLTQRAKLVKTTIMAAVASLRVKRLELEGAVSPMGGLDDHFRNISSVVDQETFLLFGLALFSYLDHERDDYRAWIWDALRGGFRDFASWRTYPVNFQAYYGSPRILWCVALLWRFAHLERSLEDDEAKRLKTELVESCLEAQHLDVPLAEISRESSNSWAARIRSSFDALLTELGHHQLDRRDRTLRFLYNRVFHRHQRHNSLTKDLSEAIRTLNKHLPAGAALKQLIALPSAEAGLAWRTAVERALESVSGLAMVTEAAYELFLFYPLRSSEAQRYLTRGRDPGFRYDVESSRRRLSRIRAEAAVAAADVTELNRAHKAIALDMDGDKSLLRKAVDYYGAPLMGSLLDEMASADRHLQGGGLWAVWEEQRRKMEPRREDGAVVLCDPLLLRETLWNILTNVRHGIDPGVKSKQRRREMATIAVESTYSSCLVAVESPLRFGAPDAAQGTLATQQAAVDVYGGKLRITCDEVRRKVRVTLRLERLNRPATSANGGEQ
jgi:hypothetical protein